MGLPKQSKFLVGWIMDDHDENDVGNDSDDNKYIPNHTW